MGCHHLCEYGFIGFVQEEEVLDLAHAEGFDGNFADRGKMQLQGVFLLGVSIAGMSVDERRGQCGLV